MTGFVDDDGKVIDSFQPIGVITVPAKISVIEYGKVAEIIASCSSSI